MPIRLNGSTSGYTEIDAPAVAGNNSIALPTGNGSAFQILRNGATAGSLEYTDKLVSGTAVASTSGTSIDFTGIPSWVKRVTVMFDGVSTNGISFLQLQAGTPGGIVTSGYSGTYSNLFTTNSLQIGNFTTGIIFGSGSSASDSRTGHCVLTLISGNLWIASSVVGSTTSTVQNMSGGRVPLSGTLDRVRVTTVNGTDTFDAGSINLLWE